MELDCACRLFFRGNSRLVFDQKNFGTQERALLVKLHNLETLAAFGHNVETAVGIFLGDGDDLRGAADVGHALLNGTNHTEGAGLCQALADHFLVARLENVKRQRRAGEQHDLERK